MHTSPAVMRNLAIIAILTFTTWTITDAQKINPCCVMVSTAKVKGNIIDYTIQRRNPPCITAVIFHTEKEHFCVDPQQAWVQQKVKELWNAKKKRASQASPVSPTSPASPASSRPVSPRLITSTLSG